MAQNPGDPWWLIYVLAPVLVVFITFIGGLAWQQLRRVRVRLEHLEERIGDAPRVYAERLELLIKQATREPERAVLHARAIVDVRNTMRRSMITISDQLNSEIDRLASEIATPSGSDRTSVSDASIFRTIEVLALGWPAKRAVIEVELRKLLAELGIDIRERPSTE